jgi:hypothetical protein
MSAFGSSQRLTFHARQFPAHWPIIITDPMICAINPWWVGSEAYASAKFTLLMASSISCVLLKPIVAQSTPAFWKANLIAFTRSS